MNNLDLPFNDPRLTYQGNTSAGFTLTLAINASLSFNNSRMSCRFEATGIRNQVEFTETALLFVVAGEYGKSVTYIIVYIHHYGTKSCI